MRAFRLGEWVVQPGLNQIACNDRISHVRPRVMDLLVFLVDHADQVVSKNELLEHVWGAKFVAESSLTTAVSEIRRAFEDDARDPWLLETIAKRGYRLIAPPYEITGPDAVAQHTPAQACGSSMCATGRLATSCS
jgi:adenylate cyclase